MTSDMIISSRMIHHRITSRGIAYYTLHDSSRDSVPSAVTRKPSEILGLLLSEDVPPQFWPEMASPTRLIPPFTVSHG